MIGGAFLYDDQAEAFARSTYTGREPDPDIGMFTGIGTAPFAGVWRGMNVIEAGVMDIAQPVLEEILPDEWITERRRELYTRIHDLRPDPKTMGVVAQAAQQLSTVATYGAYGAVGGAVVGQPLAGAATAIGGFSGYDKYSEFRDMGVDEATALKAASIHGAVMGIGAALPPFMGSSLLTQVGSGAALNVGLGIAERGGTAQLLETEYPDIAKHYKSLDGAEMVIDGIIGAAFPLGARAISNVRGKRLEVDAAMQANREVVGQTRDPVLQTTLEGIDRKHAADMEVARQIIEEGRPLNEVEVPQGVMDNVAPNMDAARVAAKTAKAVDEVLAQEYGKGFAVMDSNIQKAARAFSETEAESRVARDVEPSPVDVEASPESYHTQEAKSIALENPELRIATEDGKQVSAQSILDEAEIEFKAAEQEATLYKVAVACAIGVGE